MLLGVPKETKIHEYRIGLTPESIRAITAHGHSVLVETTAGDGIGLSDDDYIAAGATIAENAAEVFAKSAMVVKVKEPQPEECKMLRPGQVLFTYLHLAPDTKQTRLLMESQATAIAYETITDVNGNLVLLQPMSAIAGRMSIQAGARGLEKSIGGAGILLSGGAGVAPGKAVILGGGTVGTNAAEIAVGLQASVTIIDRSPERLAELEQFFDGKIKTLQSTQENVASAVRDADLVIGSVLLPGAQAPKLVSRDMVRTMRNGSVIVDVAIDQGGCFETSRPTTHADPYYIEEGVVHYCVTNMPGAVARTSTMALNNATVAYVLKLADRGWRDAMNDDKGLLQGLNIHDGNVTNAAVAKAQNLDLLAAAEAIAV